MRWARHVASIDEIGNSNKILVRKLKGSGHLGDNNSWKDSLRIMKVNLSYGITRVRLEV
jgi:hypothetical protein